MSSQLFNKLIKQASRKKPWFDAYAILIARLILWSKLTRGEWLDDALTFNQLQQGTSHAELEQWLLRLQQQVPEHCQKAFAIHPGELESIPESLLRKTLRHLTEADQQQLLTENDVPEFLLQNLAGSRHCSSTVPRSLIQFLSGLLHSNQLDSLYLPMQQSIHLAFALSQKHKNVHFETDSESPVPSLCNALLDGNLNLEYSNPIEKPHWVEPGQLTEFEAGLMLLQDQKRYNMEEVNDLYGRFPETLEQSEILGIFHLLSQSRELAIVILPQTFLQKTTLRDRQAKQALLKHRHLSTVIQLPAVFSNPAVTKNKPANMAILVFDKRQQWNDICFINACNSFFVAYDTRQPRLQILRNITPLIELTKSRTNDNFSHCISYDEIAANSYNLHVSRYVLPSRQARLTNLLEQRETKPLSSIVELIRGQAIRQNDGLNSKCFIEILPADFNETGEVEKPQKNIRVKDHIKRARQQQLKPGDILLVVKGQVGTVGLVPALCGSNWVASQAFIILRLKAEAFIKDPEVLFRYLVSPLGQSLIERIQCGDTVPLLHTEDVHRLPVPVMTEEEQSQAKTTHKDIRKAYAEIHFLREKAEELNRKNWSA